MMAFILPEYANQQDWLRRCIDAFRPHTPYMADHYEAVLRAVEGKARDEKGEPLRPFMYKKGHGPYVQIFTSIGACWIKQ